MGDRRYSKKFSVQSVGDEGIPGPKKSMTGDNQEAYAEVPTAVVQEDLEAEDDENQLNLFQDDEGGQPRMGRWFGKLASYKGGIEPTVGETKQLRDKQSQAHANRQLGTFLGVFLPSCQNIFGILLFVRVGWITGVSGALQSVAIVLLCVSCTLLTALSMSAIATNGKVPAGGSYFMISRSIGPEFGGAVGILFYLGTTIASSMYLVGAVEVFLKYMCRQATIFGDINVSTDLFNNTRVYGTILLFFVMCCVFLGIRFVSRFAVIGLASVLISITCMYIGFFTVNADRSPYVCALGDRLLARNITLIDGNMVCNKSNEYIKNLYCKDSASEECNFYKNSEFRYYPGIPGITSGNLKENFLPSYYRTTGESYSKGDIAPTRELGQSPNIADVTTSFTILLAIYFPSVTGIMAGSNRSGDLANPQVSIPRGTIGAIVFTSIIYITSPIFMAATCDGAVMRDKFGESYGDDLLAAALAWPHKWVVLVGCCLSTIGAGLQCLTGAPRLLQAIAQDNVMPCLTVFKVTTRRGEPLRAQLLSYALSQIGILIGSIDSLTPLITMFFLMLYGFVNLATMLNGFLKEPSWRPRFRFHHWFLSFIGLCLCVALMFISSWYYTLIAWAIAGCIYKYIEYRGASKEWGDATRGLQMSTAKRAILKLGDNPIHTKNWRPQILLYVSLKENLEIRHTRLLDLVYQLKAGHGLTLVCCILQGDLVSRKGDVDKVREHLATMIHHHRIRGLGEVLVANSVGEGMKNMAQCAGLGNLRHNTIMVSFPEEWRTDCLEGRGDKLAQFISTIKTAQACDLALLVPKGIDLFPRSKSTDALTDGNASVDVWCIVHDGGLLLLTSYLLMRNRVWRKCKLRIFVVASQDDDTVNLRKDMSKFIYDLRINAEVDVVAMDTEDISAYVAQRTANIEERRTMLMKMNLSKEQQQRDPQLIVDLHRRSSTTLGLGPGTMIPVPPLPDSKPASAKTSTNVKPTPLITLNEESRLDEEVELLAKHSSPESDDVVATDSTSPTESDGKTSSASPRSKSSVKFAADLDQGRDEEEESDDNKLSPTNQEHRPSSSSSGSSDDGNNGGVSQFTFSASHPLARAAARHELSDEATPQDSSGGTAQHDSGEVMVKELESNGTSGTTTDGSVPAKAPHHSHRHRFTKTQRRLHTATKLNDLLKSHSTNAALVIVNMPNPSRTSGDSDYHYMDYLEALGDGIPRILFVRGTGREVITAFSE